MIQNSVVNKFMNSSKRKNKNIAKKSNFLMDAKLFDGDKIDDDKL